MATTTRRLPRPRAVVDEPPVPTIVAGRFEVERVLRRAAGTTTLAAIDGRTGAAVVVKTARSDRLARGTRLRLLHEAEVLRRLNGRGLVPLVDAGEADDMVFLAMPRIAGRTLADRLAIRRLSVAETVQVARDLLSALATVHGHDVLHRDIKPSNVMIGDSGAATLIDFGLARSGSLDASVRDEPVGTARYTSPEQAGLVHREVDERSDLYSLGVLLFECLTGRVPFEGRTVGEVLRQHLSAPPPTVSAYVADVPTALAQIVQRLLRKDPRDRYQSAAGALADVEEFARLAAAGEPDPSLVLGLHDPRSTLTEPAFVGRRAELAVLVGAVRQAASGNGDVVLVEAESGGGKSRLLDELAARSVDADTVVLRGQGVDQAARRPFQLLAGVATTLVAAAAADDELDSRLAALLAGDRGVLTGVLPQLAALLGAPGEEEALGPEEFGEERALAALVALFTALASTPRTVVVLLDDCQWADEATLRLLRRWQRDRPDGDCRLAVVAAYRSEAVRADDPLRSLSPRRVALGPFALDDVRALVESMAGTVPDNALATVTRLAGGSPFMVGAVLRGLVESGAMFHDGQGWRTDPALLVEVQSSRAAADFLVRRLELLDDEVLDLLGAAAVLGKEFDVDVAADLAGVQPGDAVLALQALRRRHVLWLDADGAVATFVHDKLREALLTRLAPGARADLHARAAQLLLARGEAASAYDLAFHFHAAGDDAAALPFAVTAAEEARRRHALDAAEQQYRIALAGVGPDDVATHRWVQTGLGDVLMLQGRYDDAAACFVAALGFADDSAERAAIALRLGELAFKRGDMPQSVGHLEGGLRALGLRVPGRRTAYVVAAAWQLVVQAVHCLLPRRALQRRQLDAASRDVLAARIYSRLAYAYWFSAGRMPTAWAHLREMNVLERYPPTLELAQAYSEHAPVMSTLPWFGRGIDYVERSLAIRRELGDVWGQGQSLHFYGVLLYAASRFEEAIEKLTEAMRLLDRTGDRWEVNTALWHVGYCYYRLGRRDEAVDTLQRCYAQGLEIGDHQAAAISLSGIAKATGGLVAAEDLRRELEQSEGDVHTAAELLTAEGARMLAAGDVAAAVATLSDAQQRVRAAGLRSEYVAPILPWLLTGLRMQAEEVGPYRLAERRAALRRARRVGRQAARIARAYRNNLPHVLRERAALAQLSGRPRTAQRRLGRAMKVATELGMAAELLQVTELETSFVTGRLPAGPVDVAPVRSDVTRIRGTDADGLSLSLVDRFDTLLRLGRAIATALTPTAVFDVVRAAATELLRSEECSIVLVDGTDPRGERMVPLDESSGLGVSAQLVQQAMAAGNVVVHASRSGGDATVPRSGLAAPIFLRGRAIGCWYVVHRQVSDLFGPDEVRLAEFISALAGAALENAEGFAEVQALSHSLEQRVEERTAELSVANNALRATLADLERANSELRRLDELKSDFVAMVSHELRSPLTSILGYCSTMLRHWDRVDEDRKRSFVQIIDRQSRRLSGLVNDLLEMSRIESGKLDTSIAPIGLRVLVEEMLADFSSRLPDVAVLGDVDVVLQADGEHLRRVLINLLDNAIKYGEPPVSIEVTTAGGRVAIAVRDGGPGVDAEFRPRLFDKFAQASSGSTRDATGTGLGLSIVKGLMEAMGGAVRYDPPVAGVGGAFVVTLPLA